jgi:hypothetical protein
MQRIFTRMSAVDHVTHDAPERLVLLLTESPNSPAGTTNSCIIISTTGLHMRAVKFRL